MTKIFQLHEKTIVEFGLDISFFETCCSCCLLLCLTPGLSVPDSGSPNRRKHTKATKS